LENPKAGPEVFSDKLFHRDQRWDTPTADGDFSCLLGISPSKMGDSPMDRIEKRWDKETVHNLANYFWRLLVIIHGEPIVNQ
jgi:hypothetical protein